jgi:hypothetical protein
MLHASWFLCGFAAGAAPRGSGSKISFMGQFGFERESFLQGCCYAVTIPGSLAGDAV